MRTGLDTSVVVRLLVGEPAAQTKAAWAAVADAAPVVVSDLVISEAYHVLRHHYAIAHADAIAGLRALLSDARVQTTGVAGEVLGALSGAEAGPGFMDRMIHADYRRADAELLTFDRAATRLPDTRLVSE